MQEKDAIQYTYELGQNNTTLEINGVIFSPRGFAPVKMPTPDILHMTTLTGMVDFVTNNRDHLDLSSLIIHVEAPDLVYLYGPLMPGTCQRLLYVETEPLLPGIRLEDHLTAEQFNLQLQYAFVDTPQRADLLAFIGSIREEAVRDTEDDGVSQVVTAKSGIARVAEVRAPNPVVLRPYCTFPEIEQPERTFVLRMRSGPLAGLWGADGGAWRNKAMYSIQAFLSEKLPEIAILA